MSSLSSLLDLKAETLRKASSKKSSRKVVDGDLEKITESLRVPKFLSKTVLETENEKISDSSENHSLTKVTRILTKKAEIYEKLKKGCAGQGSSCPQTDQLRDKFLVDFSQKGLLAGLEEGESFDPSEDSSQLVEYIDEFGRSRMCKKADLPSISTKISTENLSEEPSRSDTKPAHRKLIGANQETLLSDDLRREQMRSKWEDEERDNLEKSDIHYNDILFDEARVHGSSFYAFSRDESQRASERRNLDSIHLEAEKQRKLHKTKTVEMSQRLMRVKNLKRKKMGLEPLPVIDVEKEREEQALEEEIAKSLRKMRQDQDRENRLSGTSSNVRAWDKGKKSSDLDKEFEFKPERRTKMSQEEWNESRRDDRVSEFAPMYGKSVAKNVNSKYRSVGAGVPSRSQNEGRSNIDGLDGQPMGLDHDVGLRRRGVLEREKSSDSKCKFSDSMNSNVQEFEDRDMHEIQNELEQQKERNLHGLSSRGQGVEIPPPPSENSWANNLPKYSRPASVKDAFNFTTDALKKRQFEPVKRFVSIPDDLELSDDD